MNAFMVWSQIERRKIAEVGGCGVWDGGVRWVVVICGVMWWLVVVVCGELLWWLVVRVLCGGHLW